MISSRGLHAPAELLVLVATTLALGACTTSPNIEADAGSSAVTPPTAPADAELGPCPAGWRVIPGDVASCDPWPASGRATCAFDEAHFPGADGCVRLGTACAADGWPSDLPTDRAIVYVDDDASVGGNGTRAHPFHAIAAGIAGAPDDGIVAIATGHYDEDLALARGIDLWGACVDGTRLTSSRASDDELAVIATQGVSGIRNLAIDHPLRYGVITRGGGVVLQDLVIDGARIDGVWVADGDAEIHHAAIRDVGPSTTGEYGRGAEASEGANLRLVLDHVAIDGTADGGVYGNAGAIITLSDVVVTGATGASAADPTVAVSGLDPGTQLTLVRSVIEGNHGDGVGIGLGAHADVTDTVIRDGRTDPSDGVGMFVQTGASASIARVHIEHIGVGMASRGAGSTLVASDVLVNDTHGITTLDGRGAVVSEGGSLTLRRVHMARVRRYGALGTGMGSVLDAQDLVVHDTLSADDDMRGGHGVTAQDQAHATLARALFERTRDIALFAVTGGSIDASDVRIADTLADAEGTFGAAIVAQDHASMTLARVAIESAIIVGVGSVIVSSVVASDVSITGITPGCFDPGCSIPVGGYGLAGYRGSTLSVSRFDAERSAVCGVIVGENEGTVLTAVDLSSGTIGNAAIGACIQLDGYDPERLHHEVRFVDVGVPLQATSYMLPDLAVH